MKPDPIARRVQQLAQRQWQYAASLDEFDIIRRIDPREVWNSVTLPLASARTVNICPRFQPAASPRSNTSHVRSARAIRDSDHDECSGFWSNEQNIIVTRRFRVDARRFVAASVRSR